MYIVSGGYVETPEYVDGGQKIVYEIIPREKTWAIEKSGSFLIEGRYGHQMATLVLSGSEKLEEYVYAIGG